jgi:hypothetical protein
VVYGLGFQFLDQSPVVVQPVTHEYEAPFPFTGTIGQVVVEIR